MIYPVPGDRVRDYRMWMRVAVCLTLSFATAARRGGLRMG